MRPTSGEILLKQKGPSGTNQTGHHGFGLYGNLLSTYFKASGFSSSRKPINSWKNCMRFFSIITV
jgi:hypothetical protein